MPLYVKLINFKPVYSEADYTIRLKNESSQGRGRILRSVISVKQPVDDYGNTTRVTTIDAYTGLDEISSRYGCTLIECQI